MFKPIKEYFTKYSIPTYIRYIGECKYPNTPTKRFDEDCKNRDSGCMYHFFNHLRQADQGIVDYGKVFFFEYFGRVRHRSKLFG